MRQYYDVYCLLNNPDVQAFIGTPEYQAHKLKRFPKLDLIVPLAGNEAFLLSDPVIRTDFTQRYQSTRTLYYKGQPEFETLLTAISRNFFEILVIDPINSNPASFKKTIPLPCSRE